MKAQAAFAARFCLRRAADDGMRSASRYFATVRRAISMPWSLSIVTIRSSDKISLGVSLQMNSLMRSRTDSDECASREGPDAAIDEVKKYFISKMPRGVEMALFEVTRLTVDSCIPIFVAICRRLSGFKCLTPRSKKADCSSTTAVATFRIVERRCSRLFTSQLAELSRSLRYERSESDRQRTLSAA